jgi:hypothetical protein
LAKLDAKPMRYCMNSAAKDTLRIDTAASETDAPPGQLRTVRICFAILRKLRAAEEQRNDAD